MDNLHLSDSERKLLVELLKNTSVAFGENLILMNYLDKFGGDEFPRVLGLPPKEFFDDPDFEGVIAIKEYPEGGRGVFVIAYSGEGGDYDLLDAETHAIDGDYIDSFGTYEELEKGWAEL